jgi:hypothetical protein
MSSSQPLLSEAKLRMSGRSHKRRNNRDSITTTHVSSRNLLQSQGKNQHTNQRLPRIGKLLPSTSESFSRKHQHRSHNPKPQHRKPAQGTAGVEEVIDVSTQTEFRDGGFQIQK